MIIGLTGPSGAGKSTVAALFAGAGFRIIDCDGIVHALGETPSYAEKVAAAFGAEFLADGKIDRKKLGALVFSDREALDLLNRTVSPLILDAVLTEVESARRLGDAVLDAPLLFEYELQTVCDVTLGVIASPECIERRLVARDHKSADEIRARLAAQHENEFFCYHCDYILENDGDMTALSDSFADLLSTLTARK